MISMCFFRACDVVADEVGSHLDADVGLAFLTAVPFALAHHAAARQNTAVADQRVVVLHHRPPTDAERRGAAPVHRAKSHPLAGDREWLHDGALVLPAIEKPAHAGRT